MLRALLSRLTDVDLADSILGDLEEQRRGRGSGSGPRIRLVLVAMLSIVGTIVLHKLRERPARWTLGRGPGLGREIHRAARSLRAAPWYAAAVIVVIGLSMALAATALAIVDGVLFKAVPYPAADRLYAITAWNASRGAGAATALLSPCRRMGVDRRTRRPSHGIPVRRNRNHRRERNGEVGGGRQHVFRRARREAPGGWVSSESFCRSDADTAGVR